MDSFQFWQLVAGLGFFLYGMQQLEQGLRGLGSDAMADFLRRQTTSPWRGVIGGVIGTACLQSSTLMGLMVLAFVGAGILELRHALGIILGANLGSTFTGWIVTLIGFKVDISHLALPLVAVGSMAVTLLRANTNRFYLGNVMLGFGLLFYGLGFMKESVEAAALLHANALAGLGKAHLFVIALAFSAIIHSSAATMMIVLSMLHAGIIDLPTAAVMAIGADLGTTSTMLLGGMAGSAEKKRVAMAHLLFNLANDAFALLFLMPILFVLQSVLGMNDPLFTLVAFHSTFNLLGIVLFMPFLGHFSRFLESLFRKPPTMACAYISKVPDAISEEVMDAIMVAVQKETHRLLLKVLILEARTFKIEDKLVVTHLEQQEYRIADGAQRLTYEECYSELKEIEGELMTFIYSVQNNTSFPEQSEHLSLIHHGIHMLVYAAKTIKDIRLNLADIRHEQHIPAAFSQDSLEQHIRVFCRSFVALSQIDNDTAYQEELQRLDAQIQQEYEQRKNGLIVTARSSSMSDIQLSTLLHINKSIHFAHKALLEAAAVRL